MKILVTGANGYIGMRLLPYLVQSGHEVYCAVRDPERLSVNEALRKQLHLITIDFLHTTEKILCQKTLMLPIISSILCPPTLVTFREWKRSVPIILSR